MAPLWTITLFAELTLCRDGTVLRRFRSQKAAALLAFLAFYRGRSFSREYLCEMLWPGEEAAVARNRLRVTLASLRRQLEPPGIPFGTVIETIGNGEVRLRPEVVQTDVALFEAALRKGDAAQAAALFRGPLLPTFYEEWILGEQERLAAALDRSHATAQPPLPPGVPDAAAPGPETERAAPSSHGPPAIPLPLYLTRFIGREEELIRLRTLLTAPDVRIVTLTGPGGCGKTRLATEAVRGDPTLRAFVPLADLWDASRLSDVLRQAIGIPPTPGADPLAQVAERLRGTPVRLALDNVEQIALAAAPQLAELLARVPELSLLITSRRRLELPGERAFPVTPLPLPDEDSPETVAAAASVRLFLDRIQAVRPDFQITSRNAADVGAVCRQLDGIPLALELAAARAGTLTPEQMRQRLAERPTGFAGEPRRVKEDRHRSLDAVIEWSYALLPPDLRRFFTALAVFRGGWDIEAAEQVTAEPQALDFLSRLRGHSLITNDGARFRLLETLRTWADTRLTASERDLLVERHGACFLARGEADLARLGGPEESVALDRLQADEANLRVAFERALDGGQAGTALRFSLILNALGRAHGSLAETLRVLETALAVPGAAAEGTLYARVLVASGGLKQLIHGPGAARAELEAALPFARASGDLPLTARVLRSLADNALLEQRYDVAEPLYEEALALQRTGGDERGAAQTLNSLALLALRQRSDHETARRLTEVAADYFRRVDDRRMLATLIYNLGELALEQGDAPTAQARLEESLHLSEEDGDDWHRLYCLILLARVAGARGDQDARRARIGDALPLALRLGDRLSLAAALRENAEADVADGDLRSGATLLAAAEVVRDRECAPPGAANNDTRFQEVVATLHAGLTDRAFQSAWARGASLTPEQAVALTLNTPSSMRQSRRSAPPQHRSHRPEIKNG